MKAYNKKLSTPFKVFLVVIAIIIAVPVIAVTAGPVSLWVTDHTVNRKYLNKDFKAYEQKQLDMPCMDIGFCDIHGPRLSREEIYQRWQNNEPLQFK